ncbi:MAG TPA: hypothetical protein VGQ46_22760 [Thermoanaerobaculia bacterium]|nr:hypothetical protein [Thermoanaerobaculia bacterium]
MRFLRATLVSLLLLCLLTGAVNAQTCTALQGVQATLDGAQNVCRASTGGTYTAVEDGGGTSTHQWVYGPSAAGPWTPIAGATGTTYRLTGSDFPSTGAWWIALTSTPQCGSPMTAGAQQVNVYDALPPPEIAGTDQICGDATSAIAQSAAQWDSYAWSITHGTLIAGANGCGNDPTKRCISFRPDGTGEVHLSLTVTAGSCSSNVLRAVPVVETSPPMLSVSSPVCPGAQANAYTSQFPAGVRTWSVTNAHLDADYGDHIAFTAGGNGTVDITLTFTDSNGCASTNTAHAQLAGTKPVITLGTPACSTNGTASANGGWSSYDWSITNGTITNGQGTANISFSGSGNAAVVLTVTGRANFGTFSCSTASDPVTVPAVAPPAITLGTPTICPYGTDTATVPSGYANYWWALSNGYVMSGDGTNSIRFSRGGGAPGSTDPITITLYVADATGCPAGPITATVPTRSIAAPVITLGTPDICPYGTNTATVPPQYANYWWALSNGYLMSGDGTNSIRFSRGGGAPGNTDPIIITLYVQDADGCPAGPTTITVPTRAIAAPVITLGTPDICPYGTDTATAPTGYANYWWALSNGYLMSGDGTNSIRFSRGGGMPGSSDPITITLYVQDANGCPAGPTTTTVPTRTIAAPVITLATPDICKYGTNTASVPAQYATYLWSLNNGYLMSGDGTHSITFSTGGGLPGSDPGPITISVFVQDANGCPAPVSTVTVPIRSIPAPVITLFTPDLCKYGTNTASVPAQYATYLWSVNNGYLMSGDGTHSITFSTGGGLPGSEPGPVTISVFVQDANGCPAPVSTVTVPIRSIPAPVITLATPDLCKYGTNTASVPAQYANYLWSVNKGFLIGGDGTPSITFSAGGSLPGSDPDPVTISVFVQDANGCPAPVSTVTVPIRSIPAPVITLATRDICKYGTNTASVPAQYANYLWSVNNGFLIGGDGTPSITFSAGGGLPGNEPGPVTISVFVQDANGCPAPVSTVTLPIRSIAAPVITANGSTSLCGTGSVTLTAPPDFSYSWSNGATTRSITVTQPGDYFVTVNDTSGCSAVSAPTHVTVATPSVLNLTTQYGTSCPYGQVLAAVSNPSLFTNITWSAVGGAPYPNGASSAISVYGGVSQVAITASATDVATGCPVSSTVVIPVAPLAPPPMTISSDGPICYGSAVTISIPPQPAGSEIIWDYTGVKLGGGNGQTFITLSAPPEPSFSLRVRLSDSGWCTTQNTITVPVHLPVFPVLQADDRAGCAYAVKTVTVTNPSAYTSYSWGVENGTIIGPNDQPTVHIGLMGAGTNTNVTFTASDGTCPVTASAGFFATQPTAAISVSGAPYCAGRNAMLFANTDGFFHPTYLWSNGATTSSITVAPDAPGPYTVTVTNEYGCSTTSAPVTVPLEPTDTSISATGPTTFCAGGHVFLAPIMPGQSYLWSNGATTRTIDVTQSGDYSVTVNTGLCSYVAPAVHVTVNPLPAAAISASGATTLCPGGSVTLTASAASSYAWSNGATTQSITVSAAGSYSVTETNANGCTATSAATVVTSSSNPVATITAAGPTTFCAGGSVTLTASAGASYLWSTGATTQSIAAAATGNYTVTVTNANGCSATSAATSVTVTALPTATITPSGPTTFCAGGSVTLTASSGTSYLWSNGATTQSITVTSSGNYSVAVTNAAGCSATSASSAVTVNPYPTATITAGGPLAICPNGGSVILTANAADSYAWSNGQTTQSVTVTQPGSYRVTVTTGGCSTTSSATVVTLRTPGTIAGSTTLCAGGSTTLTAPVAAAYLWNTGATTRSIAVSTAGNYSVTLDDGAGCSMTTPPVTVAASPLSVSVSASATTICDGQSAVLTATASGSSGYTYQWMNGSGAIAGATASTYVATVEQGYYVVVTDAAGCSVSSVGNPVMLHVNPTPAGGFYFPPASFCSGSTNTVSGFPLSGVTYAWTVTNGTLQSVSNYSAIITAGTSGNVVIGLTITNSSGCAWTGTKSIPIVPLPPVPAITPSGPTTFCAGGNVTLNAPAGYSYTWRIGSQLLGPTTQSIVASASGNYTVTVTNASGCSATSAPITVTANPIPAATITPAGGPTTFCAGGSVALTASSGSSYLWSTGATTQMIFVNTSGNYTVTVTSASGCSATSAPTSVTVNPNPAASITAGGPTTFCPGGSVTLTASTAASYLWSTGATTQSIVASSSGNYSVTVTDANGCSATSAATTVTVNPNPAVSITASGSTTFCAGGNVTLTASSGASYLWSTGATTQSIVASSSGNYAVTVTNANGCSGTSAPTAVTVNANPPATITAGGPTTFCAGGSVTLTASPGASYLWSSGEQAQSITATSSRNYIVTVTTANGCSATSAPMLVTINPPPVASITAGGPTSFCEGGSVTLTASAASSYLWSNGATTRSIVASTSGNYTVSITDANGCSSAASAPATVTVNTISPSIDVQGPLTYCDSFQSTSLNASPATGTWYRNGVAVSTAPSISMRDFGTGTNSFVWRATNSSGCTKDSAAVVVTVNPVPSGGGGGNGSVCSNGSAYWQSSEAGTGMTYQWSLTGGTILTGAGTRTITYAPAAGATSVGIDWTATSPAGCSNGGHYDVPVDRMPTSISASGPTTFCSGGSVTLTAAAVAGANSYQWSNGGFGQSITVTAGGTYTVHAFKDQNSCAGVESAPVTITVLPPPAASISASGPTTFCTGGSVTLTASAGSSYLWSNGATTQSIAVNTGGNYGVTVTNASGCSATSAATAVAIRPLPTAAVSGSAAICAGGSSTITAALTGTAPWSVTWSDNVTQTINSGTTASRNVTPSASTTYTITSLTDANCSGTSSGSATVTVKPLPTAAVSGGGTICPGGSSTITATLTGTAPFTVLWSDNVTQTINSGTTASRTVNPAATTTYTVTSVTDAKSCPRPGTGSATVTVNAAATITTQPVNKTTTRNTSVTLSVVAAGSTPISYQWFKGNGTSIAGATSSSYTTSFSGKGTNTFYVEVWNACNTTHVKSSTVTVTVN